MGTVKQVIIGKSSLNADWTMEIFLPNCNDLLHIFILYSIFYSFLHNWHKYFLINYCIKCDFIYLFVIYSISSLTTGYYEKNKFHRM